MGEFLPEHSLYYCPVKGLLTVSLFCLAMTGHVLLPVCCRQEAGLLHHGACREGLLSMLVLS